MSSRERARFETYEQRLAIYERDGGICQYCGKPVDINSFQVAHKIARTVWTLKKYGREIIEHPLNKACTHAGACNDLIQVTNNPCEREKIVVAILGEP
jgi:5-methylcytosine-specific restriction endonuclease McrA